MERTRCAPRNDWQRKVEARGLIYHTSGGVPYWDESVCYRFHETEIAQIEAATAELNRLYHRAAEYVIEKRRFAELGIVPAAIPLVERSWNERSPSLYGRFDLAYDGVNPPKLLEYNADTPTALFEAAVTQWDWQEEYYGGQFDQFNTLHEHLVATWRELRKSLRPGPVYFARLPHPEAVVTAAYLMSAALASGSGLEVSSIDIGCIRYSERLRSFVDTANRPLANVFKLYPWEWLTREARGAHLESSLDAMCWLEPPWKMLMSSKGMLPILWELFPDHPNLVAAYAGQPRHLAAYVRKPVLSREGANVTVIASGGVIQSTGGPYTDSGYVYQDFVSTPERDGCRAVIGSWVVGDKPAGIGIRDATGYITDVACRFAPHIIVP